MEKMEANQPKEVVIDYREPEDLRSFYAHGVFGGISPHGELVLKFYQDSLKTPERARIYVDEVGHLEKEVQIFNENQSKIERKVLVEILLNPETAMSIAEWIKGKIKEFKSEVRK